MNTLVCDICGGKLLMDSGGKTATCQFCGMQHSLERMKEKIQEIKGAVSIKGTVSVAGIATVETLLFRANEYADAGDRTHAIEYYNRVLDIDPTNQEARSGLHRCKTEWRCDTEWIERYFENETTRAIQYTEEDVEVRRGLDVSLPSSDMLIRMIEAGDDRVSEGIEKGEEVQRLLSEAPCYNYHSLCNRYRETPYEYNHDDGYVVLSVLFAQGNRVVINISGRWCIPNDFCYNKKLLLANSVDDGIQKVVDEVLTKEFETPAGLFTWAGSEERREQFQSHKVQKWKDCNRCRYCGGKFYEQPKPGIRGLLGESIKICKDCGKEKDY